VSEQSDLVARMRTAALRCAEHADELREAANKLEAAIAAKGSDEKWAKRLLGTWARARRLFCECTGEPLT